MKLESILDLWAEDSNIDTRDLGSESLKIASLHNKYHKIFTHERIVLRKLEMEMKVLKLEKHEFYTQGPTKETHERGWVLPPIGKILKAEVSNYIDADKDIIELTLKIGIQHEKIELLSSIIKSLQNRGFQIKTALDWLKFTSGV
jgi:hypothetical protein